jgi:hypothetical protein
MRTTVLIGLSVFCLSGALAGAQEASSGLEMHATVTAQAANTQGSTTGGARLMLYTNWKLDEHWSINSTVQARTQPYFYEELGTQGYGARVDILQLHLTYARIAPNRSLVVQVGELSTAFGSFLQRYDDSVNPLIDVPLSYGYYDRVVTALSLPGAQIDVTAGKFDGRAQFVNSSPANRRSIFDNQQYGNWAGGIGYTIVQGLRLGVTAFRGPYLDRQFEFYFPGEADPHRLPATGYGLEAQWGHGPWAAYGELQRFQLTYTLIPDFNENTGYAELRRVLSPRWYAAVRVSYRRTNVTPTLEVYETAVGFRPNRYQLIKVGYQALQGAPGNVLALQLVTSIPSISIAR